MRQGMDDDRAIDESGTGALLADGSWAFLIL